MPGIFENSTTESISQGRHNQPLAESHIFGAGTQMDSFATDGKLRAAGYADFLGDFKTGEQLLESSLVNVACVYGLALLARGLILNGPDLGGASKNPDTSQVGIPNFLEVVESEVLEEGESIVVGVVVVPLEALGVVEDDVAGQGVVSVNDVAAAH